MRAFCLDSLCLAKTVVIKYSVARMQIYTSTRYMFLNHCLYLNIHQLPFNSTAIVLLQGGFPGPLCDWSVYTEGCDINLSAIWLKRWIVHLQCVRARAWDSRWSCLVFIDELFLIRQCIYSSWDGKTRKSLHLHSIIITCEGRVFERSYIFETPPQFGTKRQLQVLF